MIYHDLIPTLGVHRVDDVPLKIELFRCHICWSVLQYVHVTTDVRQGSLGSPYGGAGMAKAST